MIDHATIYLAMACLFGFFMAWGVGANDVANAMGTSVGSKALTMRQAIIIAVIFEAAGSLLAGARVTNTIGSGMLNFAAFAHDPALLMRGMLASLLAAGTWLLVATYYSWPVSTTHSIVGAVIGFSAICLGMHSVKWHVVSNIALSWVLTPLISALLAFSLFSCVQRFIFSADQPIDRARVWIPGYIFLVVMVIMMVTLMQGLKHRLHMGFSVALGISMGVSVATAVLGFYLLRHIQTRDQANDHREQFAKVERMFSILMIFTAASMAFAHGSNDVANAVGPLAAIVSVIHTSGVSDQVHLPYWVMVLGATGIVVGLMTYGFKVIATIGSNITQLTPSRGFAAQLATASTVVLSSGLGLPVSTTQVMVGAVLGVGLARGVGALNLRVIFNIFMSWIITLPVGAILAIVYFYVLQYALGLLLT